MKIPSLDEALLNNRPEESGAVSHRRNGGIMGDLDMAFIDMLGTLSEPVSEALKPEPAKQEPEKVSEKKPEETSGKAREKSESRSVTSSLTEEVSRLKIHKELKLLESDLTADDVKFLQTLVPQGVPGITPIALQQIVNVTEGGDYSYQGMPVSQKFGELIESAYKTGRPIRVNLDSQSSVILKINNGKVSAEFFSADQAMAIYLKQHLAELRQRLEARQLPFGTLTFRQDQQQHKHPQDQEEESKKS